MFDVQLSVSLVRKGYLLNTVCIIFGEAYSYHRKGSFILSSWQRCCYSLRLVCGVFIFYVTAARLVPISLLVSRSRPGVIFII